MYNVHFSKDKSFKDSTLDLEEAKHMVRCMSDWGHAGYVVDTHNWKTVFELSSRNDMAKLDNPGQFVQQLKSNR